MNNLELKILTNRDKVFNSIEKFNAFVEIIRS